ncbi:YCII-related domain protein [compost metagenome]
MNNKKIDSRDIVKLCRNKGFLAKQMYAINTQSAGDLDKVMAHVEEHLAFQVELEHQGIMFAAGPVFADNGSTWLGEGLVIIRAESLIDAERIAASDPMHRSGARTYQVRPWLVNEGSITVRISYSDGKCEVL